MITTGASKYLKIGERPYANAVLMKPGLTARARFSDQSHPKLGTERIESSPFYPDEIYHVGKRLSIWLRHELLRGGHATTIDRGGWASIDDLIQEEHFWYSVHRELVKQGYELRKKPGNRFLFVEEDMSGYDPPAPDEMFYLSYAITTAIENGLYNWSSHKGKKRMEFVSARLKPDTTSEDFAILKKQLGKPASLLTSRISGV